MTYEEKLDLIITALTEARKGTGKEYHPRLYRDDDNKLSKISFDNIHDILLQLEDDEKIIEIKSLPTDLKSLSEQTSDLIDRKRNYFVIKFLDSFDNWHISYILKHKSSIKNIDWINLLKAYDVMLDINEKLQLSTSTTVQIPSLPQMVRFSLLFPSDSIGQRRQYQDYRMEGTAYLKKGGVVLDYRYIDDIDLGYGSIEVSVDLLKFEDFFRAIVAEYASRPRMPSKEEKDSKKISVERTLEQPVTKIDPIYQIIYNKQRELLLNHVKIAQPDFDSENELVFNFLYDHPNKKYTLEEIEQKIGRKLNKTLHKIVENLGFEGDTKEVFISASKNAIQFRNPITKKDLEEMKKATIKLVKGGLHRKSMTLYLPNISKYRQIFYYRWNNTVKQMKITTQKQVGC